MDAEGNQHYMFRSAQIPTVIIALALGTTSWKSTSSVVGGLTRNTLRTACGFPIAEQRVQGTG